MVRARTIVGPKERIAREISQIGEEVVEAIVFVHEADKPADAEQVSVFAEMDAYTVDVADVDYSRESVYKRPGHE
jgi:hypothetical protein